MMLLLFPLAAAVTFGALSWADLRRYLPFWIPAVLIWALSIGREPSVLFLGLFLAPTIVMGVAVARHRLEPAPFLVMALSDIVLGIALSLYQSKTALWSLPAVGGWGSGAGLAAAAAILRLGSAANEGHPNEGGLVSVGWWQGAMLAYWVGGEAAIVLVVGGILLWGASAYFSHSNLAALSLAGGMLAVAAGLGSGLAGVIAFGLAGTALVMGERVAAPWLVAVLPLSLLTILTLPGTGELMALPALIFPGAWAAMSTRLRAIKPTEQGMLALPGAAALVGFAFVAALASSLITGSGEVGEGGIPVEALNGIWLIYAVAMAAMATFGLVSGAQGIRWEPESQSRYSKSDVLLPKLVPPVAWFSLFVATIVFVRLVLAGLRTAFL